jgi:hypothetical protein
MPILLLIKTLVAEHKYWTPLIQNLALRMKRGTAKLMCGRYWPTCTSEWIEIVAARTVMIIRLTVQIISWAELYHVLHTLGADLPLVRGKTRLWQRRHVHCSPPHDHKAFWPRRVHLTGPAHLLYKTEAMIGWKVCRLGYSEIEICMTQESQWRKLQIIHKGVTELRGKYNLAHLHCLISCHMLESQENGSSTRKKRQPQSKLSLMWWLLLIHYITLNEVLFILSDVLHVYNVHIFQVVA